MDYAKRHLKGMSAIVPSAAIPEALAPMPTDKSIDVQMAKSAQRHVGAVW